jgi:predicted phosphohydrolase
MLIHAGDFTFFSRRRSLIRDFNEWLGDLPHRYKCVVPGNHEYALEADPRMRDAISNAVLLIDEGVEVGGLRIWGSPVTYSMEGRSGYPRAKNGSASGRRFRREPTS